MKVDFLIGECPIDFSKVNERSSHGETWKDGDWADAIRIALSGKPVMVRYLPPRVPSDDGISYDGISPPLDKLSQGGIIPVVFISSVCDELGFVDPYRDIWHSRSCDWELIRDSTPKPNRMYNVCDVNQCELSINTSPEDLTPHCPECGSSCHVINLDDAIERRAEEKRRNNLRAGDKALRLGNQFLWEQIVRRINEYERQNNSEENKNG